MCIHVEGERVEEENEVHVYLNRLLSTRRLYVSRLSLSAGRSPETLKPEMGVPPSPMG